jgi:hypothetical protein
VSTNKFLIKWIWKRSVRVEQTISLSLSFCFYFSFSLHIYIYIYTYTYTYTYTYIYICVYLCIVAANTFIYQHKSDKQCIISQEVNYKSKILQDSSFKYLHWFT